MMHDGARYQDPGTFDGFRFAQANEMLRQRLRPAGVPDKVESSFTGVSVEWPIWGFANTAW